jgi:membrane-associated phospholipid phosphatase
LDSILNIDYYLFELINQKMSNPFFDFFLKWARNEYVWIPLYVFIISFLIVNYKSKSYFLLLFIILTVGCSDLVSSRLIKKNVKRDRPCRSEFVDAIARVKCGRAYSFTSSHATNHFAIATLLSLTFGQYFKRIKWPLFAWAALISIAQVYVGVHFPLDIFCGALVGIAIGYLSSKLMHKYFGYILEEKDKSLVGT